MQREKAADGREYAAEKADGSGSWTEAAQLAGFWGRKGEVLCYLRLYFAFPCFWK